MPADENSDAQPINRRIFQRPPNGFGVVDFLEKSELREKRNATARDDTSFQQRTYVFGEGRRQRIVDGLLAEGCVARAAGALPAR